MEHAYVTVAYTGVLPLASVSLRDTITQLNDNIIIIVISPPY